MKGIQTARDITYKLQDLRDLEWTEGAFTSGTGGMLLKSRKRSGATTWYYKLSTYDAYRGVYGHECVNELVASRLAQLLGVEHAPYRLVHATVSLNGEDQETWLCKSPNFRKPGEKKLSFDTFFELERIDRESPLEFADRFGWKSKIEQMIVFDYLIANRDRHGANIEVLRGDGTARLAPLFDNGLSFAFSCFGDEELVANLDPMKDFAANNFIGTRSLEENLRFVTDFSWLPRLSDADLSRVTTGLDDIISRTHIDKIAEMIHRRWEHVEGLRNR